MSQLGSWQYVLCCNSLTRGGRWDDLRFQSHQLLREGRHPLLSAKLGKWNGQNLPLGCVLHDHRKAGVVVAATVNQFADDPHGILPSRSVVGEHCAFIAPCSCPSAVSPQISRGYHLFDAEKQGSEIEGIFQMPADVVGIGGAKNTTHIF